MSELSTPADRGPNVHTTWTEFCQLLVDHSQFKSDRQFLSGSGAELESCKFSEQSFDLDESLCGDIDRMFYKTTLLAFPRGFAVPNTYVGKIIRIHRDDGTRVGFVRLIRENDNAFMRLVDIFTHGTESTKHGPAYLVDTRMKFIPESKTYALLETSEMKMTKESVTYNDKVYAIHSPLWPAEASEWITRTRNYDVPSISTIRRIIDYGCDFVQVAHKLSSPDDEDTQWRFSFSKAEVLIIRDWSQSQRIVYRALRLINKLIASDARLRDCKTCLCTYYFKTLMLWSCEEKPPEFWCEDLLPTAVHQLLTEVARWMETKVCKNYFTRVNMADHLNNSDVAADVDALHKMAEDADLIEDVLAVCRREELVLTSRVIRIELPTWLAHSLVLFARVGGICTDDNFDNVFGDCNSSELLTALRGELVDIHRALELQQKAERSRSLSDKAILVQEAEICLKKSVGLCESTDSDVIVQNHNTVRYDKIINNYFSQRNADDKMESEIGLPFKVDPVAKQKTTIYSRTKELQLDKRQTSGATVGRTFCMKCTFTASYNGTNTSDEMTIVESPDDSPTVNISWFIAMAYIANLYYTTRRDYAATIATCNDIIHVYKASEANWDFAEQTFPVILSTRWTAIYDVQIQMILGFYSLCKFAVDRTSKRSVYLGVCPVKFALYLSWLSAFHHSHLDEPMLAECRTNYEKHVDACCSDHYVDNGRWTIMDALLLTFEKM